MLQPILFPGAPLDFNISHASSDVSVIDPELLDKLKHFKWTNFVLFCFFLF